MTNNVRLIVVLSKLNKVLIDKLSKNLEELGLPASMYPILAHLNEVEECQITTLSNVAVITGGTVTYIVSKLEKNGYVKKYKRQEDKRSHMVKITNLGKQKFDEVHKSHTIFLDSLLSEFTDDEKEIFIKYIKHFGKKLEHKEET